MKIRKKFVAFFVTLVVLFPIVALAIMSSTADTPAKLGISQGRLAACPDKPNCVCTYSDDRLHAIDPLKLEGEAEQAIDRLATIVKNMPRTRIVRKTENYIHAEFTSFWFRFTDDVEFYADESVGFIHFRSASRVGHSDFGVNRARMEKIRSAFAAQQQ